MNIILKIKQLLILYLFLLGLFACAESFAYEVGGRFGKSCHEEIALPAFLEALDTLAAFESNIDLPEDGTTLSLIRAIEETSREHGRPLSKKQAIILMSMMLGVRAPDLDGHASSNLAHTRAEHADDDDNAQYVHTLRGKNDDDDIGDAMAIEGTYRAVMDHVSQAYKFKSVTLSLFNIQQKLYLDYYGRIDVTVNASAFHLGFAAHTIADSFSHTIRSKQDDFRKIITVMNYVEAIYPHYKESRDGIRHSAFTDDCTEEENAPVVAAAVLATREFEVAFEAFYSTGDETPIRAFWEDWFQLRTDCVHDYAACDSEYYAELAMRDPTHAYLECQASVRRRPSPLSLALLLPFILPLAWGIWRRRSPQKP